MTETYPEEEELPDLIKRSVRALRYMLIVVSALCLGLLGAVIYLLVNQASETAQAQRTTLKVADNMCGLTGDLGSVPLPTSSSELAARLVIHSRDAWFGLRCPGTITPVTPSLAQLAQKYHIPLER